MMNLAVAVAFAFLPFVSAAPAALTARACNATALSSGYYLTGAGGSAGGGGEKGFVQISASGFKAELGQTLTATVVVSRIRFYCTSRTVLMRLQPGSRDVLPIHWYQRRAREAHWLGI